MSIREIPRKIKVTCDGLGCSALHGGPDYAIFTVEEWDAIHHPYGWTVYRLHTGEGIVTGMLCHKCSSKVMPTLSHVIRMPGEQT